MLRRLDAVKAQQASKIYTHIASKFMAVLLSIDYTMLLE